MTGILAEGFFPVVTTDEQATRLFAASATEGLYAVSLHRQTSASSLGFFTALSGILNFTCYVSQAPLQRFILIPPLSVLAQILLIP